MNEQVKVTAAQETSAEGRTRIPPTVGLVLCLALSMVALVVSLSDRPAEIELEAALEATGEAGPGLPVILVNGRREEVVWYAGGRISLRPPWTPPGAAAPHVALAHDPGALPPLPPGLEVGALVVREPWVAQRYGAPSLQGGAELLALLERMEVSLAPRGGGRPRPCDTLQAGRWLCGPRPWNYVGPTELIIEGKPQTCLWLHPHEDGTLRIRLPPMPGSGRLVGRFAFSDEAAATPDGAPVTLSVELNGARAFSRQHPNRRGWVAFSVELPEGAPTIDLVVEAPSTGRRHLCALGRFMPRAGRKTP